MFLLCEAYGIPGSQAQQLATPDGILLQCHSALVSGIILPLGAASKPTMSKTDFKIQSKSYIASLPGDVCVLHKHNNTSS